MLVDQAVFTSARTARFCGYHLVATSPGVTEEEARELGAWGPSHDALAGGAGTVSVQLHPLSSGRWSVAQTLTDGTEYSGRGHRVYTQSLLVTPEALAGFGHNALALWQAAQAQGLLRALQPVPPRLAPLDLDGEAAAVDELALAEAVAEVGAACLARLADAVLAEPWLAVAAQGHAYALASGLLNCLPAEVRPAVSLATGLKFSPRRPYRLLLLPADYADVRRLRRQFDLPVLDPWDPQRSLAHPWAELVAWALSSGRLLAWARQLARPRPGLRLDDLAELARVLRGELQEKGVRNLFSAPDDRAKQRGPTEKRFLTPSLRPHRPLPAAEDGPRDEARTPVEELLAAALDAQPRAQRHLWKLWEAAAQAEDRVVVAELRARLVADVLALWRRAAASPDAAVHRRALAALQIVERLLASAD